MMNDGENISSQPYIAVSSNVSTSLWVALAIIHFIYPKWGILFLKKCSGSSMTDGSPLVSIRKSLARVKAEIVGMDVRVSLIMMWEGWWWGKRRPGRLANLAMLVMLCSWRWEFWSIRCCRRGWRTGTTCREIFRQLRLQASMKLFENVRNVFKQFQTNKYKFYSTERNWVIW